MSLKKKLSETQEETFEQLMSPESNWPNELREKFEERCTNSNGYQRDLDREVVSDYIQEVFN
ncbi:MAG: hypothetical protein OEX81_01780 [Candidatus Pacebacteria bacterium]|nr:hypothetical protein [Candidatus Paceibacterota bacterium]